MGIGGNTKMMIVSFKTLIPVSVKNWILKKDFEDDLLEAQNRLFRKLSSANVNSYFMKHGTVQDVEVEGSSWIGNCTIKFDVDNEENARREFKKLFRDMSAKGQKFKFISFEKINQ